MPISPYILIDVWGRPWVLSILEMKKLGHGEKHRPRWTSHNQGRNSKLKMKSTQQGRPGWNPKIQKPVLALSAPLPLLPLVLLSLLMSPQRHACPTPQCLGFAISCLGPHSLQNQIHFSIQGRSCGLHSQRELASSAWTHFCKVKDC